MNDISQQIFERAHTGYVLVIATCPDSGKVLLVTKRRPTWQAGRLNYPGGKIETDETPLEAAVREMSEETGVVLQPQDLRLLALVTRADQYEMFVFFASSPLVGCACTQTDEPVVLLHRDEVARLDQTAAIENVAWLWQMAVDGFSKFAHIEYR